MRDALERVDDAVREVLGGVDAPLVEGFGVRGLHDAVGHGVAHRRVGRLHVDFETQGYLAFVLIPGLHQAENPQVFSNRSVSELRVDTIVPLVPHCFAV